jgi:hypothetical protein
MYRKDYLSLQPACPLSYLAPAGLDVMELKFTVARQTSIKFNQRRLKQQQ